MVKAGEDGEEFSQQSHSNGQDEIKVDQLEEVEEVQDYKKNLAAVSLVLQVSQRLFFSDNFLPGWYRFFHLSASTILQTF